MHGQQGRALLELGRLDEAVERLGSVARSMAGFGDAVHEAVVLEVKGIALLGLNRRQEAVAAWQRPFDLWHDLGDDRAERVAARLAELR